MSAPRKVCSEKRPMQHLQGNCTREILHEKLVKLVYIICQDKFSFSKKLNIGYFTFRINLVMYKLTKGADRSQIWSKGFVFKKLLNRGVG